MATKNEKRVIVLFEDTEATLNELVPRIKKAIRGKFELRVFPLRDPPPTDRGPFEDRLRDMFGRAPLKNAVLIVTDRDLSAAAWGGLSEAAVSRAARELGIPVACYRQAPASPAERLTRTPGDGRIELSRDFDEIAEQVSDLAKGFEDLEKLFAPAKTKKTKAASAVPHLETPGTILANILKQPTARARLDAYASGDIVAVSEILSAETASNFSAAVKARLVVALGVWLADCIMQYPGALLNEVAAASYLDIQPTRFKDPKVRKIFEAARYKNAPFESATQPMWWRHVLDDLISDGDCATGRELCTKKGLKNLRYCPCSVEPAISAGYYCMASKKPISAKHSSGPLRWFPAGADLARITKTTYMKLAPWIGA
jgi:hypothetical protein